MRIVLSLMLLVGNTLVFTEVFGYSCDANDFAYQMISYSPGSIIDVDWITGQPLNDPCAALGAPTITTTGDGWYMPLEPAVPVVPVYSAFRRNEIVSIGPGGSLVLKFNHRIGNDLKNPYGIDFVIFGNAFFTVSGLGQPWTNGNPTQTILSNNLSQDPAMVSVSQDGQTWFTFQGAPFADTFAPTAAFEWDGAAGGWGLPLNPTKPLNPQITAQNLAGKTVAEAIAMYDGSAGGTGFDLAMIAEVDLTWIQYVKIETPSNSTTKAEIDAVSDVAACGDYKRSFPAGDVDFNCKVDLLDFAVFAKNWLVCTDCGQ